MSQFSEQLILETIKVFKKDFDLVVSKDEAVEHLGSFADLFLAFSSPSLPAGEFRAPLAPGIPPRLPLILDNPHT